MRVHQSQQSAFSQHIPLIITLISLGLAGCEQQQPSAVSVSETAHRADSLASLTAGNSVDADQASGLLNGQQAFAACAACHSLAAGAEHKVGPNLHGIIGRAAAQQKDYDYSPALQDSALVWTRENLLAWILGSESLVPDSWMLYYNILTAEEMSALLDYLEAESA